MWSSRWYFGSTVWIPGIHYKLSQIWTTRGVQWWIIIKWQCFIFHITGNLRYLGVTSLEKLWSSSRYFSNCCNYCIYLWCVVKENVRELYVRTDKCLFADEQSLVQKYDIGGTNFWPIEDFDMVYKFNYKNFIVLTLLYIVQALEISYYLLGLQQNRSKGSGRECFGRLAFTIPRPPF